MSVGRGSLDPGSVARLGRVVPDDELRAKRLANLAIASHVIIASQDREPVGVVYTRPILGIPNVTWLVVPAARRRGVALALVRAMQREQRLLTAICRNEASIRLARKAGFRMVLGRLGIWLRGMPTTGDARV